MKHLTHNKGDYGVALVQSELIKKGYDVFMPISSTSPFDIVVLINDEFKRIQVKYVTSKNNIITVSARRLVNTGLNKSKINIHTNTEFDILAIYCPCTNKCYYIKRELFTETISLRLSPSKNNQVKNIRIADDYVDI